MSLSFLPTLNAVLNATSAVLVIAGYRAIRARRIDAHKRFMVSACVVSALFLLSYSLYHARVGSVRFQGTGWTRPAYFTILISHTVLAIVIVPLVIRALFLAVRERIAEHKRLARWTLPIWLYVSVTGVVVYWTLYRTPR